jgi:succinoglycan biosynthesis protein ExoA
MNRPRVLHIRASNFVGGPEWQLLRYAELDRNGPWELLFGVYVGPNEGCEFRDAIRSRGLEVISLSTGSLVSSVRDLIRVLREKQIALICTHGYKADIVGLLAGRFAGVPVACFLRGWTRENRRVRLYEAVDRFCLRFAHRIVCLSGSQANRVSRTASLSAKIRIVTNAINTFDIDVSDRSTARDELRQRFGLPTKCMAIATAGRLSPEKGVGDFLDAAAQVEQRFANVRFLVFGDGVLQHDLEQKAVELGLQSHVTFAGFQRDLRSLLPGVDLFVNPSHSEEMPNVVLEGMAAGVPVVATAVGGVEEIAGPRGAVRLVPPARPEAQAEAVIELLRYPERAAELARAGHERAKEFSVEKQKEQFHALYSEILPSAQASPARLVVNSTSAGVGANSSERNARSDNELPFVSVVVPVRNEEAHIGDVLAQLQKQDYPAGRFEVLVAVGPSTDRTVHAIEEFRQTATICIRQFENPHGLSSAGRNVGALQARGDYVIFLDGHCRIPSKTLLRDAVTLFEQTGADCLCRPQPLTMEGNNLFQDMVAHTRASALGHGRDSTIYDTNHEGPVNPSSAGAMYRRSVFESIGYYDESFDACEDVEFNYRVFKAGLNSYISPRLTIFYRPRSSAASLWRQMVRYGRGRFRLIQKHRDAFSYSQMIPAFFLAWLVLGGAASALSRPFALVFGLSVTVYVAVVLWFSLALGRRHGFGYALTCPLIYLTIHLGLGAGFSAEALGRLRYNRRTRLEAASASRAQATTLEPPSSVQT